ncbi:MAG TPA: ABC transporter substrate-binding protein [Chloroflexota bacterium]
MGQRGAKEFQDLVHAGLIQIGADGDPILQLAEAVPSLENGLWEVFPDGRMRTTWKIQPGARWQDGTPFTAADVLFAAQVVRDEDISIRKSPGYASIERIEANDPGVVTVDWKGPFIQADALFSRDLIYPLPRHLAEAAYQGNKANFLDMTLWNTDFVGAGPFRIRQWEPGSHAVLAAFDGYVLGRPKLDEIEVRFMGDGNLMVSNVLAGAVELTAGRGLSISQAAELANQWKGGRVENPAVAWILMHPQFIDPDPPVIGDAQFRKALMYGMDRQAMADTIQLGLVGPAQTWLGPTDPRFDAVKSSFVSYEYDPARAVQMISALGYSRGSEGAFRSAAGQPLAVEIRTGAGTELHVSAMLSIADYWQKAGVAVTTVAIPPQRSSDIVYRATRPGFEVSRQPTDPGNLALFRITNVPRAENNFRGATGPNYLNREFDDLVGRYFATIPQPERTQLLAQILHHVSDQLVMLPIFYDTEPAAVSSRILSVLTKKLDVTAITWNAAQWDLTR